MIVGEPFGLISAMLLPATSVCTLVANLEASSRHTFAAGPSNPEGAGVSSKRFRNASEDGLSMSVQVYAEGTNSNVCVATDAASARIGAQAVPPLMALPAVNATRGQATSFRTNRRDL